MTDISALVVPENRFGDINQANINNHTNVKLSPAIAADGRSFLPVDLLTDCGPGQTWESYATILQSLLVDTVTLVESA